MTHIIPLNDIYPHTEDTTCKCKPSISEESGEMIVVHNSFDGREGIELTNEILTKNESNN